MGLGTISLEHGFRNPKFSACKKKKNETFRHSYPVISRPFLISFMGWGRRKYVVTEIRTLRRVGCIDSTSEFNRKQTSRATLSYTIWRESAVRLFISSNQSFRNTVREKRKLPAKFDKEDDAFLACRIFPNMLETDVNISRQTRGIGFCIANQYTPCFRRFVFSTEETNVAIASV